MDAARPAARGSPLLHGVLRGLLMPGRWMRAAGHLLDSSTGALLMRPYQPATDRLGSGQPTLDSRLLPKVGKAFPNRPETRERAPGALNLPARARTRGMSAATSGREPAREARGGGGDEAISWT